MIVKTVGEVCDELSITGLKIKRVNGNEVSKLALRWDELNNWIEDLIEKSPKVQEAFRAHYEKLDQANTAIWNLESDLRTLKLKDWFKGDMYYIEIGKRAESIRHLNAIRVKHKNEISHLFGDYPDIKVDHLSSESQE